MFDLSSYSNGLGLVMLGFVVGLVIGYIFKVIAKIGYLSIFFALLLAGNSYAAVVNGYSVTTGTYSAGPSGWYFQGSNDSNAWNTLDTQNNVPVYSSSQVNNYTFTNSTDYRYYKFNVTGSHGTQYWNITELKLMNNLIPVSVCMTSVNTPSPYAVSSLSSWSTAQGTVQAFDCGSAEYVSGSGQLSGWLTYDFGAAANNTAASNNVLLRADVEQGVSFFSGTLTAIAFILGFAVAKTI